MKCNKPLLLSEKEKLTYKCELSKGHVDPHRYWLLNVGANLLGIGVIKWVD